jgi:AraC-like DNA-binding protein
MLRPLIPIRETHIVGPRCREWEIGPEVCPQMEADGFCCIGHSVLLPPYRTVRVRPEYAMIVACNGGEGDVLAGGSIVRMREGQALLCPRGASHAFDAVGNTPWLIAWAFFDEGASIPFQEKNSPELVRADVSGFCDTIRILAREAAGEAEPAALQPLSTLLRIHAARIGGGRTVDERLARLWEKVQEDLGRDWTVPLMAKTAAVSEEHLRRLSVRDYGQSPMRRLSQLRMQRACVRLNDPKLKLETIAGQLGFSSMYAFSAAFKRTIGVSPSGFRAVRRPRGSSKA